MDSQEHRQGDAGTSDFNQNIRQPDIKKKSIDDMEDKSFNKFNFLPSQKNLKQLAKKKNSEYQD